MYPLQPPDCSLPMHAVSLGLLSLLRPHRLSSAVSIQYSRETALASLLLYETGREHSGYSREEDSRLQELTGTSSVRTAGPVPPLQYNVCGPEGTIIRLCLGLN
ncbi:hypothetical protein GDO81_004262 [Engystomops pustulosus]|uniref:Uncharacterized protein n=1 Tax=Engystomops pustulosus TaxID=76066 RepID=A0AAV6ZYQ8_ENGPU|nr:hypothetical protein GDO81_004262 [Engystomops pustulosus]